MTTSPRLAFTELAAAQAVPETTVNEIALTLEQGASKFIVKDRDLATPPGSPAQGDCYLVAASPTGAWTGKAGYLAFYLNTAWAFIAVQEGFTAWVNDEDLLIGYNGASWVTLSSGTNPTENFIVACSDETTALTAGPGKVTFRMPYAFTVTAVRASLTTSQTSGSIFTVDINEGGASILSTKLTIDNTEKTSVTAATPAVISDASLADDAEITVDIDQIGDGTAKGLKIVLIGHR